jgi:rhamnosyltransferase
MSENVFSVLVLYNASQSEADLAVQKSVELGTKVVVCNNSTDDIKVNNTGVLKTFNFGDNLGIAKAQSIGMHWAFNKGADFVLQMDQDSEPEFDLLNKLMSCYAQLTANGYNVGLVGAQDFDKDTKEVSLAKINKGKAILEPEYISVSSVISSGSLIPKKAYKSIGGMDDDLFIDAVDFEFCWRLKSAGYLVVKNNQALLSHKLGDGKQTILGFMNVTVCSPIRHYYQFRNIIILIRRNYVPLYWKCSSTIKLLFKFFIYPLTLPNGFSRFKYMFKGTIDGILGRKGKIR